MKKLIFISLFFVIIETYSQTIEPKTLFFNVRLSLLVFPPITPLLTLEVKTFNNLSLQLETNFVNVHGINLKYYVNKFMSEHYVFVGSAFLESDYLRKDEKITFLPYAGYGYSHRFGKDKVWIFDSRLGFGQTINAGKNLILPVLKTGIGRTF